MENFISLNFSDVVPDEGGLLAESLTEDLRQVMPEDDIAIRRSDAAAQDFGGAGQLPCCSPCSGMQVWQLVQASLL